MSLAHAQLEQLKPEEYKALYEIGRVINRVESLEAALREIVHLARPAFIFDNIVLYTRYDNQKLVPTYARSVGRGRTVEADMDWGEIIANEVFQNDQQVVRHETLKPPQHHNANARLNQLYYLGLPIALLGKPLGALIFIRFGGPPYLGEQINFAMLIAEIMVELLERQHLVQQVATLEAERQLDRLQEHFVANVSHELRSPLGFIKGYATTLLRQDTDWDAKNRREFLIIIDEETDRLTEIIDNMLDSSRLQAGTLPMEFQAVQLAAMLQDFAHRMQARELPIRIDTEIETSPNTVWADSARLAQVFDNLVNNAAKYAPESVVTIKLTWQETHAHISIQDHGPGIPDEHLDDIFKRFYRLPRHAERASGSGLGLFICREIIHAHRGEIFAESGIGEGAIFHVLLPRDRNSQL